MARPEARWIPGVSEGKGRGKDRSKGKMKGKWSRIDVVVKVWNGNDDEEKMVWSE